MSKKPRGSIHKVREFELEKINLVDEFDILQIVGEGWFGKILLVEHRVSQTEMVLKAVPKPYVSLRDFYREFHYGLHLGIHRNIVTTYDVAFETAGFYVFTQEYAPLGDLTSNVTDTGVGEVYSKRVAKQIAAALDYMHSKDIVHRDVKLDNVLIYRSDFSRVKLCDFGESFQAGTVVERRNEWLPYSPPEVLDIKPESTYNADPSHDVWQFGIVIFVCLTGCLPWQKAASDDPRYMRYLAYMQGTLMLPIRRTPKLFKLLSSRAQRMFRRFLEPRADRRPKNFSDLAKFLDDRWLAKTAEKEMAEYETDELCPSMYSFHSSPDEKHRLLYTLADCGIETNVDRQTKKNRIKDWIESSVITEEDEEENEETNSASPSSSLSREPVKGHISSIRTTIDKSKDIKTTLKDATQKHFDPRTGALQQGPSEMGGTFLQTQKSSSPSISNISVMNNADSLCSSMLTLGSRQDLLSSNLQIFNSEMGFNRLGEPNFNDHYVNHSLSSGNLLTMNDTTYFNPSINRNTNNFVASSPVGGNKALQRTKSDSLKAALSANMAATNIQNDNLTTNTRPNNVKSSLSSSLLTINNDKFNANKSKSVTFVGLSNAFESLAHITLPPNAVLQDQQMPSYDFNHHKNNFQVKDSGYGSLEKSDSPLRNTVTNSTSPAGNSTQINGTVNSNAPQQLTQQQVPVTTIRTQSSQQQRIYKGAQTASMKDTAYDRTAVTNNAKKRR